MVLTVNIYYKGKDGAAIAFAKEMIESGIVAEIRSKEGNLKYDYFLPLEDKETLLLIDQWTNQEALDEHHQSKTMQKILDLRKKYQTIDRKLSNYFMKINENMKVFENSIYKNMQ